MRHRDEHKLKALLEATMMEVSEHGFSVTSVARIAKAAGMSPGTVYLYYRDKEALLEATFVDVSQRIIDVAVEAFQTPSSTEDVCRDDVHQLKTAMRRVWQALIKLGRREPALFRFHDQFLHSSHMTDALKIANQQKASALLDAFEAGKRSGILKPIELVLIEIFMFRTIYSLLQGQGCQVPPISDASFDQGFDMAWDAIALRS